MNSDHNSSKCIGKYKILGELGRGGMGVVYKALDPYIERTLAIKTIKIDSASEVKDLERWKKRFLREAKLAGRLSHKNIITIHDVGEDSGLFYIAMEYVPGQSLRAMLESRKRLPFEEVLRLMGQICNAISYAHKKGVIHCDIKPDNILLDENENIIIADFGIARTSTSGGTQTVGLMVTPSYAAPERLNGKQPNAASDIFSMGAMLYEMATGQKPFPGDSISTVFKKILYDDPQKPTSVNPDLPEQIDFILAKALAKDPKKRYQSCAEFFNDLTSYRSLSSNALGDRIDGLDDMTFSDLHIPKKKTFGKYLALSMSFLAVIGIAGFSVAYVIKKPVAGEHDDFRIESSLLGQKAGESNGKYSSKISTQEETIQLVKSEDAVSNTSNQNEEYNDPDQPTTETLTPKDHVGVENSYSAQNDYTNVKPNQEHKQDSNTISNDKKIGQTSGKTVELRSESSEEKQRVKKLSQSLKKGKQHYAKKKYDDAITEFKNCISIDPDQEEAKKYLALAQKQKKQKENIGKFFYLGKKSLNERNFVKAKSCFGAVLKLEPENSDAGRYLQLADKEEKIAEHFSKGVKSYNAENYEKTIAHFREVLKLDSGHAEAKKYIEMAKLEDMNKRLDKQITISANDQGDAKLPKGW